MSILELNTEEIMNTPDLEPVEPGEYNLRVENAKIGTSDKTGGKYILVRFSVEGYPNAKTFTDVFMVPTEGMDERQKQMRQRDLKNFFSAFAYTPGANLDTDELEGLTGNAILTVENDEKYGEQNRVSRYVSGQ